MTECARLSFAKAARGRGASRSRAGRRRAPDPDPRGRHQRRRSRPARPAATRRRRACRRRAGARVRGRGRGRPHGDGAARRRRPCGARHGRRTRHVLDVPDGCGWPEAGGFVEVFATAHDALFTQAELQAGERLLVNGAAGGVGVAAVQLGARRGAQVTGERTAPSRRAARARRRHRRRGRVRRDPRARRRREPRDQPRTAGAEGAHLDDRHRRRLAGGDRVRPADAQARAHPRLAPPWPRGRGEGGRDAPARRHPRPAHVHGARRRGVPARARRRTPTSGSPPGASSASSSSARSPGLRIARMDVDIAVLGGGPGGYTAAIRAAQLGAKVVVHREGAGARRHLPARRLHPDEGVGADRAFPAPGQRELREARRPGRPRRSSTSARRTSGSPASSSR